MTRVFTYLLAFVSGMVGYLALSFWAPTPLSAAVFHVMQSAYGRIGITFPVLAVLTVYLASILFLLILEKSDLFQFRRSPRYHLLWIENASPMLGFLGTLVGLSAAMSGLDTSKGIQSSVVWLTGQNGQAIYSSIYGAVQALIAYGIRFFFRLDGEGAKE